MWTEFRREPRSTVVNITKNTKSLVVAALWVLVLVVTIGAFEQNPSATGFLRSHFGDDEGLSYVVIDDIAQTHDGFLWLVTNGTNVIRFDGKNFQTFDQPLPRTLAVGPDGDLWVGTSFEGLIRIPSSTFSRSTLTGLVSYHPG